ncbi:MAG: hypothetical protein A3G25_04205 [Betaproteobacteria bacterium RIFCSPLOWO2_12_FULL_63_13]|nr:MAG: hypothetical protein A3G25_04205 [Betaproteobacteria bacterium RIFCSPLOWO2_12_FULL_63_13]
MMQELNITPPYGYDEITPLQKSHRVLLQPGKTPGFCRTINALAVSYSEFAAASRHYPIVFISGDGGSTFVPAVVLGLASRQNLFVTFQGEWDPSCYVPAYVRRYPFCISKLYVKGLPRGERMVCVAKANVNEDGAALFDASGSPTREWAPIEQLLNEYEADLDLTARMCATFARLGLFSPFQFQVIEPASPQPKLDGMYRIDQAKLLALKPLSMKVLVTQGFMGHIYAHFHSLDNFAQLYRRAVDKTT